MGNIILRFETCVKQVRKLCTLRTATVQFCFKLCISIETACRNEVFEGIIKRKIQFLSNTLQMFLLKKQDASQEVAFPNINTNEK